MAFIAAVLLAINNLPVGSIGHVKSNSLVKVSVFSLRTS